VVKKKLYVRLTHTATSRQKARGFSQEPIDVG
jgi:hypothetical protein